MDNLKNTIDKVYCLLNGNPKEQTKFCSDCHNKLIHIIDNTVDFYTVMQKLQEFVIDYSRKYKVLRYKPIKDKKISYCKEYTSLMNLLESKYKAYRVDMNEDVKRYNAVEKERLERNKKNSSYMSIRFNRYDYTRGINDTSTIESRINQMMRNGVSDIGAYDYL